MNSQQKESGNDSSIKSKKSINLLESQPIEKSEARSVEKACDEPSKEIKEVLVQQIYKSAGVVNSMLEKKNEKKPKTKVIKLREGSTQELIPLKEITYGLCHTTDGRYTKIIEVIPLNFFQQSCSRREYIAAMFRDLFKVCPDKIKIHVLSDSANPLRLINHLKRKNNDETNPKILKRLEEHIAFLTQLSSAESLTKRFFIEYEYRGDREGKRSSDIKEIVEVMYSYEHQIRQQLENCGNGVILSDDYNYSQGEILYYFYNRKTSREETLDERIVRVSTDAKAYNEFASIKKEIKDVDCIAPKGFKLHHPNYIVVDGTYYTYLSIKGESIPMESAAGWLNLIPTWDKVDLTINIQRLPHDITATTLEQITKNKNVLIRNKRFKEGSSDRVVEGEKIVDNNNYVLTQMRAYDEDLFNVTVTCTIRGNSPKQLIGTKNTVIDSFSKRSVYVEDSFLSCEDYFYFTMPLMVHDTFIFNRCKRNFLTSSLKVLYPFTSTELVDVNGVLFGTQRGTSELVYPNIFNTARFSNANMLILGGSGAGKTFFEQCLGYRLRFEKIRVFYILPIKGYLEYHEACENMGGSFVTLAPSSKDCINIMEIRGKAKREEDLVDESDTNENISLVSQKTTAIVLFINLLLKDSMLDEIQSGRLQSEITKIYEKFGISTSDNNSIFADKELGVLKPMPIIEDLYQHIKGLHEHEFEKVLYVLEPFITGIWKNMNGQTNVDLDNPYTMFDVNERIVGKGYISPILFIVYDYVCSRIQESRILFDVLFLDEVWKMLCNEACAEYIYESVKIFRGYAASVILASQEPNDFINAKGGFGTSVISNTQIKLFLKMEDTDINLLCKHMDISKETRATLQSLEKTKGLLFLGRDIINVDLRASEEEIYTFTTDPNIRREIAMRRATEKRLDTSGV